MPLVSQLIVYFIDTVFCWKRWQQNFHVCWQQH